MDTLTLRRSTAPDAGVAALLQAHFALMRSTSPEESCHVLAPDAVYDSADMIVTAHAGAQLVGIGAYQLLSADHAELKSMHTTAAARGRGVGRAVLLELLARARTAGVERVSLETGSMAAFAAARALYAAHGFAVCPPFGSYVEDPLSTFMTRMI